jgi:hypothetical protein
MDTLAWLRARRVVSAARSLASRVALRANCPYSASQGNHHGP